MVSNSKVEEVVEQIKSWPTETRIALARRVLETLEVGSGVSPAGFKGPSAQQVLGLWNSSGGAAPTDDQCDDILADELRRKHATLDAAALPGRDFEDNVTIRCTVVSGMEAIVTRNLADFSDRPVPAFSPTELLSRIQAKSP